MKTFEEFLLEANPNKTVAAARRRMGGFPARPSKELGSFMKWVAEKAIAGGSFKTIEDAKDAYKKDTGHEPD